MCATMAGLLGALAIAHRDSSCTVSVGTAVKACRKLRVSTSVFHSRTDLPEDSACGYGLTVHPCQSRPGLTCTRKECSPRHWPSGVYSWANTTA